MDPWTPKFTKADYYPNRVIRFWNKTNLHVIWLFTARAVNSEWTHVWPASCDNNDGRTDYLRLSNLTALPAGVNNHLRCIHKGLSAFSRVTPSIQMHDQAILNTISVPASDTSGSWLPIVLSRHHNIKKKPWVVCLQLTCHYLHIVGND